MIARDKFPKLMKYKRSYTQVSVRENNGQDITFVEDSSRLQKTRNTIIIQASGAVKDLLLIVYPNPPPNILIVQHEDRKSTDSIKNKK